MQRLLSTLVLVAGLGLVAYQAREISALRIQGQMLVERHAPLEAQVRQLTLDRDHASGDLASLRAENDRLKRASEELFKLRGEVALLRSLTQAVTKLKDGKDTISAAPAGQTETPEEAVLSDQQKIALRRWMEKLKTGNSVDDLERLKDSLKRWDELFINPAPPEMKPVFVILKKRLRERITELENQ